MFKIKIYADGADVDLMKKEYNKGIVKGFTTNPSLMKKAGVADYNNFAKDVLEVIPDLPISFEVFADDFETMEKEAKKISSYGENVFVKIPIMNSKGESSIPLIKKLSEEGVKLNVTAIMTLDQVEKTVEVLQTGIENIVSVFAGRIADTGVDPEQIMKKSAEICHKKQGVQLLWASSREVFNIIQAEKCGADIITCTTPILAKLSMIGLDLNQLSLNTVKAFHSDIKELGYSIL